MRKCIEDVAAVQQPGRSKGDEQERGLKETKGSTKVRHERQKGCTFGRKGRLFVSNKSVEKEKAFLI